MSDPPPPRACTYRVCYYLISRAKMGLGALAGYTTSIEKSLMRKEIHATFDQVTAVWWSSLSNASVITLQPVLLIITMHSSCQRRQRTLLSRECVYVCANKVSSKQEIKLNIIIWAQVKMRCLTKLYFFWYMTLCIVYMIHGQFLKISYIQ